MKDSMEFLSQNQFVEQIVETYRGEQNRFCFILGAGASVESGVPTGTALEMRWMNCLMGVQEDFPAPKKNPEETRLLAKKLFEAGKISHPFETLEQAWRKAINTGCVIPSEFYFDIYSLRFYPKKENGYWYLERIMEGCRPSVGYHTLALLLTKNDLHNLVITTNFDSLVEDALNLYSNKKPMVAGHESLADYIDPNIRRPIVAKVHRSLFYEPINTPDNSLDPRWGNALQNFFASYTPVVIGYGGGDRSLMNFLKAKTTKMRHGLYWCCRNGEDPGKKVAKLVADKGGYLVSIQGFDALMLAIGVALFKDDIIPPSTASLFEQQSSDRMIAYNEQWFKWMKHNSKANFESINLVTKMNIAEQEKQEKQDPMTVQDYYRRANFNYKHGKYDEAVKDYTTAIELRPDFADAYNSRGLTYFELRRYDRAIEDYTNAIKLNSVFEWAYFNRGNAFNEIGQYSKAIDDCNKAIKIKPDSAIAFVIRGIAYYNLGQSENAIEDYTRAIKFQSDYAFAFYNRGIAYNNLKQYDRAIEDYTKAINLEPNEDDYYTNRSITYRKLGKYDYAAADEVKAAELKARKKV